ncbi:MAG: hypothetical protein IM577_14540 [Chitinophagaceae bacterium]|jgi:hypothetical protein|nr:hypothetical protein [Chitinophagaceae bacterium]
MNITLIHPAKSPPPAEDFAEKKEERSSLWSLAIGLWLDYLNVNDWHTKD